MECRIALHLAATGDLPSLKAGGIRAPPIVGTMPVQGLQLATDHGTLSLTMFCGAPAV